jgi:hypothetical protein
MKDGNNNKFNNISITPNKNNLNNSDTKHLLFFSNYCEHSKELLAKLKQKNVLDKVHLVCIDNRFVKNNITYVYIDSTQTMPLPPMITCVPTMCILPNYEVLKGTEIMDYFVPITTNIGDARNELNVEPNAFSIESETNGLFGVSSDNFSFWDTASEDLTAQGNAGTRQMYNYASIRENNQEEQIYTPVEEESGDKLSMNLEQIQQQRNSEI